MKKLIVVLLLTVSTTAAAHGWNHGGYPGSYQRGGYGWGPFIGGAIAGAVIYDIYNRPQPVIVQQPPVIVQQPPVVQQVPAQVVGSCPYPYQPYYNRVWNTDQYGRQYPTDVFAGCR